MRQHPRSGRIVRAVERSARALNQPYFTCRCCGEVFKKGEKSEYYAHRRRCEAQEERQPAQPTQLGLFGERA